MNDAAAAASRRHLFEIDKPVQQGGRGGLDRYYGQYWTYPIHTTFVDSGNVHIVSRRYSDFEKLVEMLTKQFPWCIMPPIPAKEGAVENIVSRASDAISSVHEARRSAFSMFLTRLSYHDKLGTSTIFRVFLQCESVGWDKEAQITEGGGSRQKEEAPSTWWNYLTSTLQAEHVPSDKAAAIGFNTAKSDATGSLTANHYLCAKTFLRRFGVHVGKIRDAIIETNKHENEYSTHLRRFSEALGKTMVEGQGYEESASVLKIIHTVESTQLEVCATMDNHLRAGGQIRDALDYICRSLEFACRTLQNAQQCLNSHEELLTVIGTLETNHDVLQQSGGSHEQLSKVKNDIADARERSRMSSENATRVDRDTREELRRFVSDLHYDFENVFKLWQKTHHEEMMGLNDCWQDLAEKVRGLGPTTEPLPDYLRSGAYPSPAAAASSSATHEQCPPSDVTSPVARTKSSAPLPPQPPNMMNPSPLMSHGFEFNFGAPVKVSAGILPHWAYKIDVSANLPHFTRNNVTIFRRYSDFEWLKDQLSKEYPFSIIPPVPEKDLNSTVDKLKGDENKDMIEYRKRALRKFLLRIGAHPYVATSRIFQDFLELDDTEWERRKKSPPTNEPERSTSAAFTASGAVLTKAWTALATEEGAPPVQPSGPLSDVPATTKMWGEFKDYLLSMELTLGHLKVRMDQLTNRRYEASYSLREFHTYFGKVGAGMNELDKQAASSGLGNAIVAIANHSNGLAKIYDEHAFEETRNVVENIKYYQRLCLSVRETLGRMEKTISGRNALINKVEDLLIQRDKASGNPEKLNKIEIEIALTTEKRNHAVEHTAKMELLVREELRRFHREKQYDMKGILKAFADHQMDFAAKMRRAWEDVLPTVEQVRLEH